MELLVVITIIAVMSVSATVGFGSLQNTLSARETAAVMQAQLSKIELEALKNAFSEARIYVRPHYLAAHELWENSSLIIPDTPRTCSADGFTANKDIRLTMIKEGRMAQSLPVQRGDFCFDFENAPEDEWQLLIESGGQKEALVLRRIVPAQNAISLSANGFIRVRAPYAEKTYFDNSNKVVSSLTVTIQAGDGGETTITLK